MKKNKKGLKIGLAILAALVVIPLAAIYWVKGGIALRQKDENSLPKFIKADFVDLDRMFFVSKFRSQAGHDFSGGGETCRSMKHYFEPTFDSDKIHQRLGYLPPEPDGKTDIAVYSPVDGLVKSIKEEKTPLGKQIAIQVAGHHEFTVRIFHVYLDKDIKALTRVKAGQKIGVLGQYQGTDIAVQYFGLKGDSFVSYFQVMSEDLLAKYKARGISNLEDVVLNREYRDTHPFNCKNDSSDAFEDNRTPEQKLSTEDYVYLSGYPKPKFN